MPEVNRNLLRLLDVVQLITSSQKIPKQVHTKWRQVNIYFLI